MALYVVEHADGSGPMSIPLSHEDAKEFANECNMPYKIVPTLQRTINLFTKVNKDCEQSGEQVVPFAQDADVVDFYMQQMDALDFSVEEMAEFESFLKSQPFRPQEV